MRDNILLGQAMLIDDVRERAERLKALSEKFADTDGGLRGLYELGMLKVRLWQDPETDQQDKKTYLAQAKEILSSFGKKCPDCVLASQTQKILERLPQE